MTRGCFFLRFFEVRILQKVQKGRENCTRLREIADEILSVSEAKKIKQRVDEVKLFYQTEYVPHLKQKSTHSCSCMVCGFNDKGTPILYCNFSDWIWNALNESSYCWCLQIVLMTSRVLKNKVGFRRPHFANSIAKNTRRKNNKFPQIIKLRRQ
jgi:hypothetical protein